MALETIEVDLGGEEALALVEASFARAKVSPSRTWDDGWKVERKGDRLLAYPRNPRDHLLEPLPEAYWAGHFPEILAIEITAVSQPGGGTQVTAWVVRRHVWALIGAVVVDIFNYVPFVHSIMIGVERLGLRRNREGARVRMLRLALEPLLAHERPRDRGPFRRG